jgi:hypothetical protein
VDPFEVYPRAIQFGELPEGAGPTTRTFYYWSATRGPDELTPPTVRAEQSDPFLRVAPPTPMTADERAALAVTMAGLGRPVRVRAGYKCELTALRKLPEPSPGQPAEPDIGPFERQVVVLGPAQTTSTVLVAGAVTGLVKLSGGSAAIDLGSFPTQSGSDDRRKHTLVSDRTDLTLEPLPDESRPKYLKLALSEPQTADGKRYWELTVTVPGGVLSGALPPDSSVAFRGKTSAGEQKIRIAVTGRGFGR